MKYYNAADYNIVKTIALIAVFIIIMPFYAIIGIALIRVVFDVTIPLSLANIAAMTGLIVLTRFALK